MQPSLPWPPRQCGTEFDAVVECHQVGTEYLLGVTSSPGHHHYVTGSSVRYRTIESGAAIGLDDDRGRACRVRTCGYRVSDHCCVFGERALIADHHDVCQSRGGCPEWETFAGVPVPVAPMTTISRPDVSDRRYGSNWRCPAVLCM